MEFKFDIRKSIRWDQQGLYTLLPRNDLKSKDICEIIDVLGRESSRAQSLRSVITTSIRFFTSSDNKIYLKSDGSKVVGILKTGSRKLFYTDEIGKILELSPVCLLDFYVHESYQRSGYGKELYEYMLRAENTSPNKIAIDRPSQKLIAFMRKHYGLSDFIPQNNNYVIYRQYFVGGERAGKRVSEEVKAQFRPGTQREERIMLENCFEKGSGEGGGKNNLGIERSPGEGKGNGNGIGIGRRELDVMQRSPGGEGNSERKVAETTGNQRKNYHVPQRSPGNEANSERKIVGNTAIERIPEGKGNMKEENRVTYAPIPPWATTARFTLPNTTSSQYGNHAFRK